MLLVIMYIALNLGEYDFWMLGFIVFDFSQVSWYQVTLTYADPSSGDIMLGGSTSAIFQGDPILDGG